MGQLFQIETERDSERMVLRSTLLRLLDAVIVQRGEIVATIAHSVGHPIEDTMLHNAKGDVVSLQDLLEHKKAIVLVYPDGMCERYHDELLQLSALLGEANSRLFVITPERNEAASCRMELATEDEPQVDDKNNVAFDLEVSQEDEVSERPHVESNYNILSDINYNFITSHGLAYTVDDEVKRIFKDELETEDSRLDERAIALPAIYIVNEDGVICYAHLSPRMEERPAPEEIVAQYNKL